MLIIIINLLIITKQSSLAIPITLSTSNTPTLDISYLCPEQPSIEVLLDTGSQQFWLTDDGCWSCQHTMSFCPQISTPDKLIKYVMGQVEGSYSFISVCGKRKKFLCVKSVSNMALQGHGLLGIGGQSTGKQILSQFYASNQIQQKILTFYFGKYQNLLFLGSSFIKYTSQTQKVIEGVEISEKWKIKADGIEIGDIRRQQQIDIQIDSGSSKIVLPRQYFSEVLRLLTLKVTCMQTYQGIACHRLQQMTIKLRIGSTQIRLTQLLDRSRNMYNVVCHPQQDSRQIILGFPLFKQYIVSTNTQDNTLSLYRYDQKLLNYEVYNHHIIMIIYTIIVIVISYGSMWLYGVYKQRGTTKIII